jgi:hypothetical protein
LPKFGVQISKFLLAGSPHTDSEKDREELLREELGHHRQHLMIMDAADKQEQERVHQNKVRSPELNPRVDEKEMEEKYDQE